jgi:hypothetical protein
LTVQFGDDAREACSDHRSAAFDAASPRSTVKMLNVQSKRMAFIGGTPGPDTIGALMRYRWYEPGRGKMTR